MSITNGSFLDDLKYRYRYGGMITRLIMINISMFLIIKITVLIADWMLGTGLGAEFFRSLTVSSDISALAKKPWSLITHMFTHEGFFHILFNMLILYWFGVIFKDFIGETRVVPVYILGALAGIGLYLLAYNTFPALQGQAGIAFGASAGVMAILIAASTMTPNFTMHLLFLGPVQLKWIAIAMVVIDVLSIPENNTGGHIAHLGGALFGFVFALQYKQGHDWTKPFYTAWDGIKNFFDFSSKKNKKSKVRMAYKNKEKTRAKATTAKTEKTDSNKQEKIDSILDKISQSGYDSLSAEEKAFLFKMSKE